MERLRDPVGAEVGAEAARVVLRAVDEDAAARRTCADAEPIPTVVPDCLEQ